MTAIIANRSKVYATGGDVDVDFTLGSNVDSFVDFPDGEVRYCVLAATGEWQVGIGNVLNPILSRGVVEENYLGTTDQIDFTGLTLQIAIVFSSLALKEITDKLDLIEDGATGDLTGAEIKVLYENEPDTNAFDDDTKEKLFLIEDEAKDDQIASEVPYTPTTPDVSVTVQEALDTLWSSLDSKTLEATQVFYDPTDDKVTNEIILQDVLVDHASSIEQRVASISGISSGGQLSANVGGTQFNVSGGAGQIVDSYTNPDNSSFVELTWDPFDGIDIAPESNNLSVITLSIFISSPDKFSAQIVKITGAVPFKTFRNNIYLGSVSIMEGVITAVTPAPSVIKQTSTDTYDLLRNEINITGGQVLSVEGALSVWQKGGKIFFPGINWFNTDHTNPNEITFIDTSIDNSPSPRTPVTFSTMNQYGLIDDSLTVIPTKYDLAGTPTILGVEEATVHRLYRLGFNDTLRRFVLVYGQNVYSSADIAKANLLSDTQIDPVEVENMYFIGYICVEGGATDFSDSTKAWVISGTGQNITSGATQTANHDTLTNKTLANQHPITAIGTEGGDQLDALLTSKVQYAGDWVNGLYDFNDMVTSGGYLSLVTNPDGTLENPIPTLVGDPANIYTTVTDGVNPIPEPAFIAESGGGVTIKSGMRYTFANNISIQQILCKVPAISSNTHYKVTTIVDPDGPTPSLHLYTAPALDITEWAIVDAGNTIVSAGTEVLIYIEAYTTAGSTDYTDQYVFLNTGNGAPAVGEVIRTNAADRLRISVKDNLGVDRSYELSIAKNTDTFKVTQDGSPANWELLEITGPGSLQGTAPNDYYEFPIYLNNAGGGIAGGAVCTSVLTLNSAGDTKYFREAGYLTGTNYEASLDGYLNIDGIDQPAAINDAFSVDLRVQTIIQSPDWKVLATSASGISSGSDGGGSTLYWGSLQGPIADQTDLQAALDAKVDDGQVLTDVPAGAVFTDSVYTHPSGDGFLHVPTTGNSNAGKVLTAGASAGLATWEAPATSKVSALIPPTSPSNGQEWLNTGTGSSFTWYSQGTGQWVQED